VAGFDLAIRTRTIGLHGQQTRAIRTSR